MIVQDPHQRVACLGVYILKILDVDGVTQQMLQEWLGEVDLEIPAFNQCFSDEDS